MRKLSLQKVLGYAAGVIALLSFLFTVLWRVFTLTTAVEQQVAVNDELRRRVGALETAMYEGKLGDHQLTVAKITRDLNEIETQFCSADNLRNVTEASHMRIVAVLWEKVFGAPYQISNAFYPKVCNRQMN
jgi:hypothetical protein